MKNIVLKKNLTIPQRLRSGWVMIRDPVWLEGLCGSMKPSRPGFWLGHHTGSCSTLKPGFPYTSFSWHMVPAKHCSPRHHIFWDLSHKLGIPDSTVVEGCGAILVVWPIIRGELNDAGFVQWGRTSLTIFISSTRLGSRVKCSKNNDVTFHGLLYSQWGSEGVQLFCSGSVGLPVTRNSTKDGVSGKLWWLLVDDYDEPTSFGSLECFPLSSIMPKLR